MPRPATGSVVEPKGSRKSWGLRFRAGGKRQFVTLGRPEEGWNREKAEEALRHTLADVERGIWQPPVSVAPIVVATPEETFFDFANEWFAAREPDWRPNTVADYRWALELHLLPYFKDFRSSSWFFWIAAGIVASDRLRRRWQEPVSELVRRSLFRGAT